jgi:hypothetical protein
MTPANLTGSMFRAAAAGLGERGRCQSNGDQSSSFRAFQLGKLPAQFIVARRRRAP